MNQLVRYTSIDPQFSGSGALSADSNTLAVGTELEDSSATGVNGDQAGNSEEETGAVYVY